MTLLSLIAAEGGGCGSARVAHERDSAGIRQEFGPLLSGSNLYIHRYRVASSTDE